MSTSKPDSGAAAVPDHEAAAALVHKINEDVSTREGTCVYARKGEGEGEGEDTGSGPPPSPHPLQVYNCRYADQELRIMWQYHDESEAGMMIVYSDGSMEGGGHVDEYEVRVAWRVAWHGMCTTSTCRALCNPLVLPSQSLPLPTPLFHSCARS
jgi:hypothetical protein